MEIHINKTNDAIRVAKGLDERLPQHYGLGPYPLCNGQQFFSGPLHILCKVCLASWPLFDGLLRPSTVYYCLSHTNGRHGPDQSLKTKRHCWSLSSVACANSPQEEELQWVFRKAVFRETLKPKAGRWISSYAKTCKVIQVRVSELELGTPDYSWGNSEHSLEPVGMPGATGV